MKILSTLSFALVIVASLQLVMALDFQFDPAGNTCITADYTTDESSHYCNGNMGKMPNRTCGWIIGSPSGDPSTYTQAYTYDVDPCNSDTVTTNAAGDCPNLPILAGTTSLACNYCYVWNVPSCETSADCTGSPPSLQQCECECSSCGSDTPANCATDSWISQANDASCEATFTGCNV